jgi:DNA repair exonuclease SbcCD ATPase subunit
VDAANWDQWILETRDEIPKARLFESLLELHDLRRIAKARGVKPQGFRVERAPAGHLARELARRSEQDRELREELSALLEVATTPAPVSEGSANIATPHEIEAAERRSQAAEQRAKDADKALQSAERSAKKARESLQEAITERDAVRGERNRLRQRVADLERQLESLDQSLGALKKQVAAQRKGSKRDELTALRQQVEEIEARDKQLRLQNAELSSQSREFEERCTELEELLPRGKRERLRWRSKEDAPKVEGSGFLPRFEDSFLRSLQAFERQDCARIWGAIAQLLLHGTQPKGLYFKALQGAEGLHSIRAAAHLRIYFVRRGDEFVFEHAGHREQQDQYLKKRRDH